MRLTVSGPSSFVGPSAVPETMPRGSNFLRNSGFGRPVRVFEILVAVEVVEVAPELVEAVPVRQMLFEIAEVVLAELRGRVAPRLEDLGERDVFLLQAGRRARRADRRQAGAHRQLAGDERRAPGGAARLRVERREAQAFPADAVDVGRLHAHDVAAVGGDVHPADVVAKDDEDVRRRLRLDRQRERGR